MPNSRLDDPMIRAALNVLDGQVVTGYYPQHTQKEFLAFMNVLDRRVPSELQVHVVLDNLSVHKGAQVRGGSAATRGSSSTSFRQAPRG